MIAKYEIIKQDIIQMIEEKKFKPGDKIYSEGELKKLYNVSSTTVVRALQDLVLSGYLIRKQGEGTYVRKNFKHRRAFFDEGSPIIEEVKNKYSEQSIVESKKMLLVRELEDKEIIKERIKEATKYIPLERLCLSPQCGFASCEIGNQLTEEEEWAKLALVKEIAHEVWGD